VLFDGSCALCNRFVVFALKNDPTRELKFMTNQAPQASAMLASRGLSGIDAESVIVIDGQRALTHSDAALYVLGRLRWPFSMMGLLRLVPRCVRDRSYRWVSRRRLAIFGRVDECQLIPQNLRDRIIDGCEE